MAQLDIYLSQALKECKPVISGLLPISLKDFKVFKVLKTNILISNSMA
jgi:hypothetical protein